MTSHTLEQMDKLFVLGGCRRHGNDCALVWNVEDGFSIHLPSSVCQARHELVQLSDKVVLDASNDNSRQTASNLKAFAQGHNNHFSNKQQQPD